ncbi:hypothetical protein DE146DRAFT_769487, partial [Phaeosphaeria sp. MPI-PUGE-AT-0046c]
MESDNLRSEADILARQSRPQRNSTWTPRIRDWRYATGVIQHEDFQDAPKSRSVWDTLDYDYRGRSGKGTLVSSEIASSGDPDTFETIETDPYKPMKIPKGLWTQVTRFIPSRGALEGDGENKWELTGLIVRIRYTGKNKANLQEILERPARTQTICTPHKLDSIESLHKSPLFQRQWVDETLDFKMQHVRSKLRHPAIVIDELGANYQWYTQAVPIDALLPPGVPISAKEILAFYPHHVRWKGIAVRLLNNDYRASDMLGIQRDAVKSALPGFKTSTYKGKADKNLHTDELKAGHYVEVMRRGFILPTFDDLVRGLKRLPSGLDARGLTQSLSWYLNIRNTFNPKLELNVLHTQSLIRALHLPLKPFGPQNLDRNALEEWRSKQSFETVEIEDSELIPDGNVPHMLTPKRSRMHLNLGDDSVSMELTLPIRHVLTLPFVALHGVVCEALKSGITKAENRLEARTGDTSKRALEAKCAVSAAVQPEEGMIENPDQGPWFKPSTIQGQQPQQAPPRILKHALPIQPNQLSVHKKL